MMFTKLFCSFLIGFFSSIIVFIAIFYIFQLDFMLEKIKYESTLTHDHEKLLATTNDFDKSSISLGRVGSLIVDFEDFFHQITADQIKSRLNGFSAPALWTVAFAPRQFPRSCLKRAPV